MIICIECNEIILDEMSETPKGPIHVGGCPTLLTKVTDIAPFGQRLTVSRSNINLTNNQMDAIQRLAKAIHVLDQELTAENIQLMWPSDTDQLMISGPKPGKPNLENYLRTTAFIQDMAKRGVRLEEMEQQLTTEQLALVQMMVNPEGRKLSVILKRAGVTQYKLDGWMKQPIFKKYVTAAIGDTTNQALLFSEIPLTQRALDGDMNALKFLYEWKNKYNPAKANNAEDAKEFVMLVLNAVQKVLGAEQNGDVILSKIQKLIELEQSALSGTSGRK